MIEQVAQRTRNVQSTQQRADIVIQVIEERLESGDDQQQVLNELRSNRQQLAQAIAGGNP